jgi:hypothetical protein
MVGGTGINVPVGVHSIGRCVGALILLSLIIGVAVPALPRLVLGLAADLAGDVVRGLYCRRPCLLHHAAGGVHRHRGRRCHGHLGVHHSVNRAHGFLHDRGMQS